MFRTPDTSRRLTKIPLVPIKGRAVGVHKIGSILLTTHAEVRKVVQEEADNSLTILGISMSVENVLVPDLVDQVAGHYFGGRVHQLKSQETPVLLLSKVKLSVIPAFYSSTSTAIITPVADFLGPVK